MTQNRHNIRINQQRLWDSIMHMAKIGPGAQGGSRRLALTDEDRDGRDLFIAWCKAEDCIITVDDMGNIFARRAGRDADAPPICSGSHLDTQPHGGKFDGIYGVLAALEVIRTLNEHAIQTRAPLEIVVWTNEEGARFAPAMIASGVFAGLFEKEYAWARTDSDGKTLGAELERIGYLGAQKCGDHPLGALLEAHIEQGPILERAGDQIGVVVGAQGVRWYDITVQGQDAHAGSTPMAGRQDAMVAAARLVQLAQSIALDNAPHGVATVGELHVTPNSRNTIPGKVFLTIDLRHPHAETLAAMADKLTLAIKQTSDEHGITIECREIWHNPAVKFDPNCIAAVTEAAQSMGLRYQSMVSGAGHDACQVCRIAPTSMIFVPCAGGLSHNEAEHAEPADLAAGCNVLLHAMLKLAGA